MGLMSNPFISPAIAQAFRPCSTPLMAIWMFPFYIFAALNALHFFVSNRVLGY